jgi:hypothetical protein
MAVYQHLDQHPIYKDLMPTEKEMTYTTTEHPDIPIDEEYGILIPLNMSITMSNQEEGPRPQIEHQPAHGTSTIDTATTLSETHEK